uniref:G_PROTEIN_RECEP_F1_2 domain-containing protein n=1 Tax=Steinernema glaseri TaxID=37863 RepID=A0A1I8A211_9BILA
MATSSAADYGDPWANLTDDEYVDVIVDYLKPSTVEWLFVFVFLLVMVVGVVGNVLVVYVVIRNKCMWSSMNLFLTNLAFSDLLVLIFCLPPTVINDITKTFWGDALLCKLILFFQNTSVYVSVLTLVCISIERWKAVSTPLAMPLWHTPRVILVIWLASMGLSMPEPITLTTFPPEYARQDLNIRWGTRCKESWSESFQQKYQLTQTIFLFLLPLGVITALCVHMLFILNSRAMHINDRHLRNRKKAAKMLIMVVLIFAISYLPVHLHNLLTS